MTKEAPGRRAARSLTQEHRCALDEFGWMLAVVAVGVAFLAWQRRGDVSQVMPIGTFPTTAALLVTSHR